MALRHALLAACLFALTLACGGGSLDDQLTALEDSFHAGDYAAVQTEAPKLLERANSESAANSKLWSIEKLNLKAIARQGKGKAATAELERMSGVYPDRVDGPLYVSICNMVAAVPGVEGAVLEAVEVLKAGADRFPEYEDKFEQLAVSLAEGGGDDVNEALSQLGYLK